MSYKKLFIKLGISLFLLLGSIFTYRYCIRITTNWSMMPPGGIIWLALYVSRAIAVVSLCYLIIITIRVIYSPDKTRLNIYRTNINHVKLVRIIKDILYSLIFPFVTKVSRINVAVGIIISYLPLGFLFLLGYHSQIFISALNDQSSNLPEWQNFKTLFIKGLKICLVIFLFIIFGWLLIYYSMSFYQSDTPTSYWQKLSTLIALMLRPFIYVIAPGYIVVLNKSIQITAVSGVISLFIGLAILPSALLILNLQGLRMAINPFIIHRTMHELGFLYLVGLLLSYVLLIFFAWLSIKIPYALPIWFAYYGTVVSCFWAKLYKLHYPQSSNMQIK